MTPINGSEDAPRKRPVAVASLETRASSGRSTVICLHASGGSGAQWKSFASMVQPHVRVLTPDLYGHGMAPPWQGPPADIVSADATRIARLVRDAGGDVHLVGHSYGGAIALRVALHHPERIRSVAVYEPVALRILFDYNAKHRAASEIAEVARDIRRALNGSDGERAARRFLDYWAGAGHWMRLTRERQTAIASRMPVIHAHFLSLIDDRVRLRDYSTIRLPVLSLTGRETRSSTRRIGELLKYALPQIEAVSLDTMGHLGPVTHAEVVAQRFAHFLQRQAGVGIASQRMAA